VIAVIAEIGRTSIRMNTAKGTKFKNHENEFLLIR
jgi:hypothetical protein